jgi:hypothetical protein
MRLSLFFLSALALRALGLAAQTAPLPAPVQVVPLAAVQVRPPQRLTLRAPGEAQGLFSRFSTVSMTPGRRVAVWHPAPDSGRRYLVRAVRVRLGSRLPEHAAQLAQARRQFAEGGLALRMAPATAAGAPADTNLLASPLQLTPALSAQQQNGWVRFDVAGQRVLLPARGAFVVVEGLPSPGEQVGRTRLLLHPPDGKHPPEDYTYAKGAKPTEVFSYTEMQVPGSQAIRLVRNSDYPAIGQRQVAEPAEGRTWQQNPSPAGQPRTWYRLAARTAQLRLAASAPKLHDYNYDLELEVEEF